MASSLGFVSRRKQSKPQRHQDLHRGSGSALSMDIEDLSDSVDSSPIDLSTKGIDRGIFEDKSRLFLASLSSPQHLLSLCAQLAANRDASKETIVSASEAPAPQIEPRTEEERTICCVASGCDQVFSSRGRLLWHIVEDHSEQKLLLCDQCGRRFGDRDQIREHDCLLTDRPSSAGADRVAAASPDADRGSVPTSSGPSFSLVERTRTPVPTINLFNEMFPSKPHVDLPMGPLFPLPMPQFAHGPHPPPPFFVRPPFEHRPDIFAPRQENGEDDWEALMEISTTDEGEKIRALVGDKAMPTTDPNQCILCRRVLSCKSALQMHYRTHTGERPFKCKICQRAFTTKGNLKTHMGVHRAKHSFRGVPIGIGGHIGGPVGNPMSTIGLPNGFSPGLQPTQQCPICQKRFMTAMQLQSHISEHTQALTGRVMPSMTSHPSPIKMIQTGNGRFSSGFPIFPFFTPSVPHGEVPASFNLAQLLGNQLNNVHPPVDERSPAEAGSPKEEREDGPNVISTPVKLDVLKTDAPGTSSISPSVSSEGSASSQEQTNDHTDGSSVGRSGESDIEEKRGLRQTDSTVLAVEERPRALSTPLTAENPLEAMQKMWAETEPPPPRQLPVLSKHQCAVCFKHFSSSSALQIHMRTHTGDKPFKCEMCGRAFTTRGNLKVHMGTHMWQQSPSRRGRRIFDAVVSDVSSLKPPTGAIGGVGGIPILPPLGLFPPTGVPNMEMMMMLWRTVCSVCQKVCASPSELEQHLKDHLNGSLSRDASSPQSIHTD